MAKNKYGFTVSCFLILILARPAMTQTTSFENNRPLQVALNSDSSRWLRFHTYAQLWARFNENNPGTTISGVNQNTTTDLSIRRFRLGMQGLLTERLYGYLQLGINNLNYLSPRGTSLDLLDAYAEFRPSKAFHLGGGKTAWSGLSRYSAPNTSKLLTYDLSFLPLPTNNELNDLIRKLSLFAKGQLGQFDYRVVVSKPFSALNSDDFDPIPAENLAKLTDQGSGALYSAYFKWAFHDSESNQIPFSDGTYLGKKSVMNIGIGFEYESNVTWYLAQGDTLFNDLLLWSVDFFLDQPLNQAKNTALTFYAAYFNYDFGPNYLKNIGVNNPGNEGDLSATAFNGPGNAYPVVGTGNSVLFQTGWLLPKMGPEKTWQLQPYTSIQYSDFQRLKNPMVVYNIGVNWYLRGHLSKLALNLENRPIFANGLDQLEETDRKSMIILQYLMRLE